MTAGDLRKTTRLMEAAIRFARRNEGLTGTNPSVACLLVDHKTDPPRMIASGITAPGGRPHAEPLALANPTTNPAGAVAFVTLEPCAHHGRTPPCAQTLIDAAIESVVTAVVDPDSRVSGKGHGMLENAGISVTAGICAEMAGIGLASYLNHKTKNRPQVILKLAVSMDGYLGLRGGGQVAITGPSARAQSHLMRARNHAILVGAGTIVEDDPMLNCRLPGLETRSPIRIVLDPNGRIPLDANVVVTARKSRTIMVCRHDLDFERRDALTASGCEILPCEFEKGRVALPELLEDLGSIGIMSLMVEGGAALASSFLREKLVDELLLFEGGVAIDDGSNRGVASPILPGNPPTGFSAEYHLRLGPDRMTRYRRIA